MAIQGYWRLNGNSNDASGNSNNGTDTDITYSQANGITNGGASFSNVSTSKIATVVGKVPLYSMTFSAMLRHNGYFPATNGPGNSIFGTCLSTSRSGFFVWGGASGDDRDIIAYYVNSSGTAYGCGYCNAGIYISTNTWFLFTFVSDYNNKSISIYMNGIFICNSIIAVSPLHTSSCKLTIGKTEDSFWKGGWVGNMDNVIMDNIIWPVAYMKNEYARVKGFF